MERWPVVAALGRGRLLGPLLRQGGGKPLVGALLRMRPEARGTVIREFVLDSLIWAVSEGAARALARAIELNMSEFLGRKVGG